MTAIKIAFNKSLKRLNYFPFRLITLLMGIIGQANLFAQGHISGSIKNNKNEPIEFATIALKIDSSFSGDDLSDSTGSFSIKYARKINNKSYL